MKPQILVLLALSMFVTFSVTAAIADIQEWRGSWSNSCAG